MVEKENVVTQTDGKIYTVFLNWNNQYCQNDYTTRDNLHIQCNSDQITNGTFHRTNTQKIYSLYGRTRDTE